MTDYETIIAALSAVNLALTITVIVGNRGDRKRMTELEGAMRRHDERLACVETAADRSPTHDDLAKIYDRVNETSRLIHRVEGVVESMNGNLNLLLHRTMRDIPTRT
ncbi:DUF2730 family protein [uncultured Sphaerotilus sp.]|uniref:DUF2730 family protein n=1 Tax=uncultured Sphaerotilus sp. TaxID=474984 RepID=UPI0030CA2EC8